MKLHRVLVLCVLIVWAMQVAPRAFGQGTISFAQLNGTIEDPSARAVAGAALTLRNLDTNQTYSATSNSSGFYVVPNLPPGRYELTVQTSGFAKYVQTGITLTVGQAATIDVPLKVASTSEVVNVNTEAPSVEPTRSETSQVIDEIHIDSLPTNGRQFVDFALLTPGVATGRTSIQSTFTETEVTRISFGGMRDLSNAVTVDGADYVNLGTGSQRATPSQEAVSEFRVVNNSFGAEYGRALGGIVNIVTKSGTNDLHGDLYGYFSNRAANARSLLQTAQFDQYRRGQYGASLGGPLAKDRTFFFMNYEGQRMAQSPTYPATLLDNLDTINLSKQALNLPVEDLGVLNSLDHDNGFVRLDHQLSPNNRLAVHYGIFDARNLNLLVGATLDGGGIGAPSSGHSSFIRDQSLVTTLNTVLKPQLVNTALVQYARRHNTFPAVTGQPNLDIPNTLLFGHNFGTFDAQDESRVQFSDSLAWVKGKHYWRFGADYNYIWDWVIWPGFTPMRIIFPGFNCMVDFANYVDPEAGIPQSPNPPCAAFLDPSLGLNGVPIVFWGAPVGTGPIVQGGLPPQVPTTWANAYVDPQDYYAPINHGYIGGFAQDQWHITPKLTFNYGLRWDFETGLTQIINHDFRGWQPRVGLAYSPTKKTVVRAGYGIFDDHYNMTFLFVTYPQREVVIPNAPQPWVRHGNETATWVLNLLPFQPIVFAGQKYPDGSQPPLPADAAKNLILNGMFPPNFSTGPPGSLVTNSGGGIDHNSRIPYSEQASVGIDQDLGKGLVLSVGYLFVASHKQVRPENLNVCPPDGLSNSATDCPPASAVGFPNNQLPDGRDAFSGPLYSNAGLMYYLDDSGVSVYHGGNISLNGHVNKNFSFNASYTLSHTHDDGTFTTFVSTPQDLYKRNLERANSVQDVRHRFIANVVADGPANTFLKSFEFSDILNLQSGRPFTIFVGNDINNDTNPVTDRVGWSPRNSYRGDPLYANDVRLAYLFHLRETRSVQLAVDAFNVFNRPNVDEVTSVYGGGTIDFCGAVPKQYKDSASLAIQQGQVTCPQGNGGAPFPNPLFGTPRTMFNPRQLQFSAKFTF
ncbi:MAG TPA: carboxypeptidase regulatory-like domain-containing protein [Terriglobales bacterium]|nr:carboxypeptidase regulatory-like domain-containing protein [Terriglobales bacterium]